ncbi:hypothetical protein [uncultured Enterovirga sp.]|uniref:hypothetical protein n=1 Tax=uncultured Enterovirga sp. TaxID=2026352 RepID=UPI0035C9D40E
MLARCTALLVLAGLAGYPNLAQADGPGPGLSAGSDGEAAAPRYGRLEREVSPRPPRRLTGGPGYVGSEWGLGKPSYYGIGTRPDWGRSSGD